MTLGIGNFKWLRSEDLAFKQRVEQVFKLLAHLSLADTTILDVGCGSGVYTLCVERVAQMAIGIDVVEKSFKKAQKDAVEQNASATFAIANAECLPFRDSCCDIVMIIEALEHIQNPENALKEAKRVLKRPGYLVISVPNRRYPFEMHRISIGKIKITGFYGSVPLFSWAPRFIRKRFETARIYTSKKITEIIEENGFIVCQVQYSIFPRLERLGSKKITRFCDRFFSHLENNAFFRSFGMSIFVMAQKR